MSLRQPMREEGTLTVTTFDRGCGGVGLNFVDIKCTANLTWDDIRWINKIAPNIPVFLKGVGMSLVCFVRVPSLRLKTCSGSAEDVRLAYEYGAAGVVLSKQVDRLRVWWFYPANVRQSHGGRQLGKRIADFSYEQLQVH
jgi:hypothetical protein